MTAISYGTGHHSGTAKSHFSGFMSMIVAKWREHQLMRDIESVPYSVMKDVGYPAAERTNEK